MRLCDGICLVCCRVLEPEEACIHDYPEVPIAFQDESGDLYCPEHARNRSRPYAAADLRTWRADLRLHCDVCGCKLR